MQILAQDFLPIAERAGCMAFVDIETTGGLNADFGSAVVVSIKPFGGKPVTFTARPGRDKAMLKQVVAELAKYQVWVTFYGKLFDIPFLNSRLIYNGLPPLDKKHHIDIYFIVKARTKLSRRNQGHLLSWLKAPQEKMSVGPSVWAELAADFETNIAVLIERCESDVIGLEDLYKRTKGLIGEITK